MTTAIATDNSEFSEKMMGWMRRAVNFTPKRIKVNISAGNMKLKKIWNINTSPTLTCKGMKCLSTGCYAMKAYKLWPSVRQSWDHNTNLYFNFPTEYFDNIILQLSRKRNPVDHVRWHSGGEIIDPPYFEGMKRVAREFPDTKFLCFTKKYGISKFMSDCPENLSVIFSAWEGMKVPESVKKYNVAWVDDGSESEQKIIKENSTKPFRCGGDCGTCKMCWNANKTGNDIVFHKH